MPGLGIDYNLLGNMGERYQRGQELGMNRALMPLKVQSMQQELQTGQLALEEKQKLAQFGNDLSQWAQANPDKNVWDYAPSLAMKYGLSGQALGFLKANAEKTDTIIKQFQTLAEINPQKAVDFINSNPDAKAIVGNMTMQDLGPQVVYMTEKDIPGLGTNQIGFYKQGKNWELIKPTKEQTGFTLGPGQKRYSPTGEVVAEGPPPTEKETSEQKNFETYAEKAGIDISTPEKWRVAYEKWSTLKPAAYGNVRLEIANLPRPTGTPGITYSPKEGFQEEVSLGTKQKLTSPEVKQRNLQFREEQPTTDIKVMQQSVPSVLQLINQSRMALANTEKRLGPLEGRWRELYSGKVGASDPDFRKLRADLALLQTRLMKMHVGARGGEYMMKHFEDLFDATKDSPQNLRAALDEIEAYANEVGQSQVTTPKSEPSSTPNPQKTPVSSGIEKSTGRKVVKYSDGSIEYAQ